MVGPDYHAPHPDAPPVGPGWRKRRRPNLPCRRGPAELTQWWKQFDDPVLTQLVEDALKANLDVNLPWPSCDRPEPHRASPSQRCGRRLAPPPSISGKHPSVNGTAGHAQNLYQAGFDAAWELDVFGGQRRNVESAKANIQAAVEGISDVQVTLVAEVALDYIQLRGYQQQIAVAQNNLKSMQDTALIARQKANAGFNCDLDIANADANVATTEAQIPVLETSARQSIYALSVLLARPPADLLEQLTPDRQNPRCAGANSRRFAFRPVAPPSPTFARPRRNCTPPRRRSASPPPTYSPIFADRHDWSADQPVEHVDG